MGLHADAIGAENELQRPFGGRTPTNKLKYNKHKDRVLGRWNGEPMGAPESFMVFALDGTDREDEPYSVADESELGDDDIASFLGR